MSEYKPVEDPRRFYEERLCALQKQIGAVYLVSDIAQDIDYLSANAVFFREGVFSAEYVCFGVVQAYFRHFKTLESSEARDNLATLAYDLGGVANVDVSKIEQVWVAAEELATYHTKLGPGM